MKHRKQICALLLILEMNATGAHADILPAGHKQIEHTVRFTNVNELTNHVLYIYPRDLSRNLTGNSSVRVPTNGVVTLSQLNPLAIGRAGGIYLVAIPNALHGPLDRPPEESWLTEDTKGVLKCKLPITQIRSLPKSDPRDKVEDVFEIKLVPDRLEVVRIKKPVAAADGLPRIGRGSAAILAGIAALAMVALADRRRAVMRAGR